MGNDFKCVNESDTITRLRFGKREITLIGTAHVSAESTDQVKELIASEKPDRVCIEIDAGRYQAMSQENSWEKTDLHKVLKEKKGFLLLANLVLASFQKKIGSNVGTSPGEEMKQAILVAKENNIPYSFSDRPIQTTLQRAWKKSNLWNKMKLLSALVGSIFSGEEVSEEEIEQLKSKSALDSMLDELADYLPAVKMVLIDERDQYLATKIFETKEDRVVAVIGAGHTGGIIRWIEDLYKNEKEADLSEIGVIPPKSVMGKIAPWFIPFIAVGLIVAGFVLKGAEFGMGMITNWVILNSIAAAVMTIAALGHPLTVILAFIASPITSLNVFLGAGFFTGTLQFFLKRPQVGDLKNIQEDAGKFKMWYKNRALHVLLVFLFSSIGSSTGAIASIIMNASKTIMDGF